MKSVNVLVSMVVILIKQNLWNQKNKKHDTTKKSVLVSSELKKKKTFKTTTRQLHDTH